MLEDMVWDDKIVVGYGGDSSGSDSDGSDFEEDIALLNTDASEAHTPISEETLVISQLVMDLQKMKEEEAQIGPETHEDSEGEPQSHVLSYLSPDAVSVSQSKDAKVQITGKMIHEWIHPPPVSESTDNVETERERDRDRERETAEIDVSGAESSSSDRNDERGGDSVYTSTS
jgi:hypothetical protein